MMLLYKYKLEIFHFSLKVKYFMHNEKNASGSINFSYEITYVFVDVRDKIYMYVHSFHS